MVFEIDKCINLVVKCSIDEFIEFLLR